MERAPFHHWDLPRQRLKTLHLHQGEHFVHTCNLMQACMFDCVGHGILADNLSPCEVRAWCGGNIRSALRFLCRAFNRKEASLHDPFAELTGLKPAPPKTSPPLKKKPASSSTPAPQGTAPPPSAANGAALTCIDALP